MSSVCVDVYVRIDARDVIIGDTAGTLKKTLKMYTKFNKIIRLFYKITISSLKGALLISSSGKYFY